MPQTRQATCPACQRRRAFTFSGSQRWPEAVAAQHDLPAVIRLWTCTTCHTTLSEQELEPGEDTPQESPFTRPGIQDFVSVQRFARYRLRPGRDSGPTRY